MSTPDKLSLVVFSGQFERVHYALVTAAASIATNRPTTVFFTMGAAKALLVNGWKTLPTLEGLGDAETTDQLFQSRGVVGIEELFESCVALDVKFLVCEMGLKALGLEAADLRPDIPVEISGVVTFLADASATGAMLFL
jgi:peroxiredoxin family protein